MSRFEWQLRCANSTAPSELSLASALVSVVLSLVATPCNFLICFTIYKNPHRNLRTPFNLLILNVAIADFIQGVAVLPLSAAFHGLEAIGNMLLPLLRSLHLFFFISCTASIISIAALAVDRCLSVSHPLQYRSKSTYSRSVRVSVVIWLLSTGLSFLYLHVAFVIYTFVFANCIILLTVAVLLFVHFWVGRSLKRNRERREFRDSSASGNVHQLGTNWFKLAKRDARVTRTFLAILLIFLCLNSPSFVLAYILNFCQACGDCDTYHTFRDLHFLFVLFPSSVNPFIFGWRLPHFKQALRKIIAQRFGGNDNDQLESSTCTKRNNMAAVQRARNDRNPQSSQISSSHVTLGIQRLQHNDLREKNKITNNNNIGLGMANKDIGDTRDVSMANKDIGDTRKIIWSHSSNLGQKYCLVENHATPAQGPSTLSDWNITKHYRLTSMV